MSIKISLSPERPSQAYKIREVTLRSRYPHAYRYNSYIGFPWDNVIEDSSQWLVISCHERQPWRKLIWNSWDLNICWSIKENVSRSNPRLQWQTFEMQCNHLMIQKVWKICCLHLWHEVGFLSQTHHSSCKLLWPWYRPESLSLKWHCLLHPFNFQVNLPKDSMCIDSTHSKRWSSCINWCPLEAWKVSQEQWSSELDVMAGFLQLYERLTDFSHRT